MAGAANYPTALDDDSSLIDVADGVTAIAAAHHNNLKEAIKALEARIGILETLSPTSIDFRLGSATGSHSHNGASGQGRAVSGIVRAPVTWYHAGSLAASAPLGIPLSFDRSLQILSVRANMRRAPSGATTALDINFGPTSLWAASPLLRPIFPAGATAYGHASPNLVTYPSGAVITIDGDAVGSNDPGQDVSITFLFRE